MSESNLPEVVWVYGYGRTKHIKGWTEPRRGWSPAVDVGLCGAYGGYPTEEPERPVCKRCAKKAEHSDESGMPS